MNRTQKTSNETPSKASRITRKSTVSTTRNSRASTTRKNAASTTRRSTVSEALDVVKKHNCYWQFEKLPDKYKLEKFKEYNKKFKKIKKILNSYINTTVKEILKQDNQKLVILSGLPGSGKSSISKNLKKNGDFQLISLDNNKDKRLAEDIEVSKYDDLKTEVRKSLLQGKNVVADGTFLKQQEIDEFYPERLYSGQSEIKYYDVFIIYINIPPIYSYYNNVKRCLDERNVRTLIPEHIIRNMWRSRTINLRHPDVYVINYPISFHNL